MRMQVTTLLLVCLGVWIHTAESGPAGEYDASYDYPEELDGSGDDLEISGSGSGDEGPIPRALPGPSSTTAAPTTNETVGVAVAMGEGGAPVKAAGETTAVKTEAPPTPETPTTTTTAAVSTTDAVDTANGPGIPAVDTDSPINPAETTTDFPAVPTEDTDSPVVPVENTDLFAVPVENTDSPAVLLETTDSPTFPVASTGEPDDTATPDQASTAAAPWELPEDPLHGTTSSIPVLNKEEEKEEEEVQEEREQAVELLPAETTQSFLTSQSSPSTPAPPPVAVDTDAEVPARAPRTTSSPALAEEEEEEGEEEEQEAFVPMPTENADFLPDSTPAPETDPEEMASGDDSPAASAAPLPGTETAQPAQPLPPVDEVPIVPNVRTIVEEPFQQSDFTFEHPKTEETSGNQSILERKEVLGGVIAGGVVGLAFAIMLVSLMVYRMKKKDEGSYSLDEHKHPNGGYQKARTQEEFLA